jgi:hypothetical protein
MKDANRRTGTASNLCFQREDPVQGEKVHITTIIIIITVI